MKQAEEIRGEPVIFEGFDAFESTSKHLESQRAALLQNEEEKETGNKMEDKQNYSDPEPKKPYQFV